MVEDSHLGATTTRFLSFLQRRPTQNENLISTDLLAMDSERLQFTRKGRSVSRSWYLVKARKGHRKLGRSNREHVCIKSSSSLVQRVVTSTWRVISK